MLDRPDVLRDQIPAYTSVRNSEFSSKHAQQYSQYYVDQCYRDDSSFLKRICLRLQSPLRNVLAVTLCAGLSLAPAIARADGLTSASDWTARILDYANTSLSIADGVAIAAVPMDGPGIDQYVNADVAMNPGSSMKLVTTFGALELLGPNHTWNTRLYTDGTMAGDTLEGNLYLELGGDPKLTEERLRAMISELHGMGLQTIKGDLILDGSVFQLDGGLPVFDDNGDNPHAPFLVEPSAYLSNFNLIHFQVRADERGTQAWTSPNLDGVYIDNRVTVAEAGPCPARSSFEWKPIFHQNDEVTVRVTGSLPEGCRTKRYLSLLPQETYTAALVRSLWKSMGGAITGTDRLDETPDDARLLARSTSPDLASVVREVNKWSSNVMARQLLLTIGAENRQEGDEDDRVAGIRTLYEWLEENGVDTEGMVIDNGAGLSRHERISARQTGRLLRAAWRSPFGAELIASLPLVAMDGTMHHRLRNAGMAGLGRVKTGYLEDVRSVAGFTRDNMGTTWAVVGLVNHSPAWNGQALLDRVLYSLYHSPPVGTSLVQAEDSGATTRVR